MALSDVQKAQAAKLLDPIAREADRPGVRDQLRVGYRIEGNSVVLFESRVRFDKRSEWLDHPVAKFTYVTSIQRWRLYCRFRDLKWHGYQPLPEADSMEHLVSEVRRDPTCIFWG